MAERRMFAKSIIDSARFLKMPLTSQALYFHLGCRADDDGIVEAYNVLMMCGAAEGDLKMLVAKGFVIVLNEDLVSYIADWNTHNKIRPDRKIDSAYKDLLLQVVPDVSFVESRERTDTKKRDGQPMDNQWTDNGRHRLGKVSIGKDSIGEYIPPSAPASDLSATENKNPKAIKHKYGEYEHVLLTDEQHNKLQQEHSNCDELITYLDEYIEMKGYKAKSHYLAIKKWVVDAVNEKSKKGGGNREPVFGDSGKDKFAHIGTYL